ncbi:MAG: 50S ribosome-binding GTPase [Candidatus Heimdallarchaeota archaeon]|nr:50S ribosome-binding GTPase [Candidatus Heimdallarchaeota archaeon]MCK5143386.1 50S ribosome-binding GTPase [Candidatus Heimdallarchaeota archaeon]
MPNILITGYPRVGKTTLINRIVETTKKEVVGFVTSEIKLNNRRVGFNIETFSGLKLPLASKENRQSLYRVASYGVYLENVDTIVDQVKQDMEEFSYDWIILDEIGKMELFSTKFKQFVEKCLEQKCVLGTIMMRDNDFTSKTKNRLDTIVYQLTEKNRSQAEKDIIKLMI